MFVDSHCHLSFSNYDNDRAAIIEGFAQENIAFIVNPGTSIEQSHAAVNLGSTYPNRVFSNVGIHPCGCSAKSLEKDMEILLSLAKNPNVVGIGETGIDLHYETNPPLKTQESSFREHIRLAKKLDLPVIIHTRDAWNETFRILREEKSSSLKGIFHCFSGGKEELDLALSFGFMISISGTVTFKNATLTSVIPSIPNQALLSETDSPYLSPAPMRGKRNEPKHVAKIVETIASHKNMSTIDLAKLILENAKTIFAIKTLN